MVRGRRSHAYEPRVVGSTAVNFHIKTTKIFDLIKCALFLYILNLKYDHGVK